MSSVLAESGYASAREISRQIADIYRPANRMQPDQACLHFGLRDKEGKQWEPDLSPYMIDPLNDFAGRRYTGIVFVGSARSAKTISILHGGALYATTCAPGDMMIVQMTKDMARQFSLFEVGPIMRNTPGFAEKINPRRNKVYDKVFRNGMAIGYGWPAVSQLSSKTLRYVIITDYDRPENRDNVDGEGPLWTLGMKRIETFMSRGKCVAESSPGEDWVDASWVPEVPHQAPPTLGILSIYNTGTMARWYWPCLDCGHLIQAVPGPQQFGLPEFRELMDTIKQTKEGDYGSLIDQYARIVCPACSAVHLPKHRREMNSAGMWLHHGETWEPFSRKIVGERIKTKTASYWLGGAASAFQTWDSMLLKYFQAISTYARTLDEGPLKTVTNTDFGAPYMPRSAAARRKVDDLIRRSQLETWQQGEVPEGVGFLLAAIDNQTYGFVVSVYGYGRGLECWLVDRFEITQSNRMVGDRYDRVDPATHDSDWDMLIDEVIHRRYKLREAPELEMEVYFTFQDSGGQAGVTQRAYDFWRRLRTRGLANRLQLVKGASSVDAPRFKQTTGQTSEDEQRLLGPVPLWMLNTTTFKDAVIGDLNRDAFGPGYIHLPPWLGKGVMAQYVSEVRGVDGWKKKKGQKNEAADLHGYARAAVAVIGAEGINWDDPPQWARRPERPKAGVAPAAAASVVAQSNFFAELGRKRSQR